MAKRKADDRQDLEDALAHLAAIVAAYDSRDIETIMGDDDAFTYKRDGTVIYEKPTSDDDDDDDSDDDDDDEEGDDDSDNSDDSKQNDKPSRWARFLPPEANIGQQTDKPDKADNLEQLVNSSTSLKDWEKNRDAIYAAIAKEGTR